MKSILASLMLFASLGHVGTNEPTWHPPLSSPMVLGGDMREPSGYTEFCERGEAPQSCESVVFGHGLDANGRIILTHELWDALIRFNKKVNWHMEPETDEEQYHVDEYWTLNKKAGDCEDYVLTKRQKLLDEGFPSSVLLITTVIRKEGDGHAVLVIRTDYGDYVLDNLTDQIVPWNKTRYRLKSTQSPEDARLWQRVVT